ncbi:uncharacterized protein LOC135374172, partial [Ornithodoros turicata]|uniref:uncharacterized protein LOC135374172 n=1 Tax=Ornithodoros turicata TaxID=34597 RepID=UPI0031397D88
MNLLQIIPDILMESMKLLLRQALYDGENRSIAASRNTFSGFENLSACVFSKKARAFLPEFNYTDTGNILLYEALAGILAVQPFLDVYKKFLGGSRSHIDDRASLASSPYRPLQMAFISYAESMCEMVAAPHGDESNFSPSRLSLSS